MVANRVVGMIPAGSVDPAAARRAITPVGSKVTLEQGPFADTVESLLAMADEAESWRWQLCNLRSVLEASVDMRKHRPL